jgi:hypothetical protein
MSLEMTKSMDAAIQDSSHTHLPCVWLNFVEWVFDSNDKEMPTSTCVIYYIMEYLYIIYVYSQILYKVILCSASKTGHTIVSNWPVFWFRIHFLCGVTGGRRCRYNMCQIMLATLSWIGVLRGKGDLNYVPWTLMQWNARNDTIFHRRFFKLLTFFVGNMRSSPFALEKGEKLYNRKRHVMKNKRKTHH